MIQLQSHLAGRWQTGTGEGTTLVNPTTGAALATASSEGLDLHEAYAFARNVGGPALRALSFAERAAALKALSIAIYEHREELIELGISNAGNTRGDAKFDIDGATATLAAYAYFAKGLPERPFLIDGDTIQLSRTPRFIGQHIRVPRRGVAVHINAFNFPAWGMMEKAACALLAGMPVLEKPGTPTAMMAERIGHIIVDSGILPEGAFSLLVGSARNMLDPVESQDCVAFTGSSGTARLLRGHDAFLSRGARINVEADSLNTAVLGPDLDDGDAGFDQFLSEMVREITQKAGQKCTAVRRILVPEASMDMVCEALAEGLAAIKVGDPAVRESRMGPLTNEAQFQSVVAGLENLASATTVVTGGKARLIEGGPFLAPTLLRANNATDPALHGEEVFGPVATVIPYSGEVADAAEIIRAGQGALVTSVFTDDRKF
ncbi:MAG: 3,4-dehydroadipyl-CoA semialdehyde dehydrogenase, partial [Pseudohongiellaceae bacterium]